MTNTNRIFICVSMAVALVAGSLGCGKSDAKSDGIGAVKADDQPELSAVLKAFEKEDVNLRSTIEELARMVRSGMSQDALSGLSKLSANPKLKPEQKQALDNLIASLKSGAPR